MSNDRLDWRNAAKDELVKTARQLEDELVLIDRQIRIEGSKDADLVPPHPVWYWSTVASYNIAQLTLAFFALFSLTKIVMPIGIPVNLGIVIFLLQTIHFAMSWHKVDVSHMAGFKLFGRPWYSATNGLYQVPWGIISVVWADRNYKDKRFPGPADKIYRVSSELQTTTPGGDMPPQGRDLFRPIFVLTGEPRFTDKDIGRLKEDSSLLNPLDKQLTVEISYFVRYRPDQDYGGIFRIARNLSSETGNIDERIEDLIREQSERDMNAILKRHTTATINENWDLVNEVFIRKLRLSAVRLGIDIPDEGAGLANLNPSHITNEDQANVVRALFKKDAIVTLGEAEGLRLRKVREGEAAGELAWLNAQAAGRKAIKDSLIVDGDAVLASEAVREVLKETDVILAGGEGGMSDLMRLVKGAQSAFNAGNKGGTQK
jgi:regulator of protease activity HflC (stomatin/prohibitin superfamily)